MMVADTDISSKHADGHQGEPAAAMTSILALPLHINHVHSHPLLVGFARPQGPILDRLVAGGVLVLRGR